MDSETLMVFSKVLKWSALLPLIYLVWFGYKSWFKKSISKKERTLIVALVLLPQILYITSWVPAIIAAITAIDERIESGKFYIACGTYQGMQYFPKPKRSDAKVVLDDASTVYGYSEKINREALKQLKVNERVCVKYLKDLPLTEGSPEKMIFDIQKEK